MCIRDRIQAMIAIQATPAIVEASVLDDRVLCRPTWLASSKE